MYWIHEERVYKPDSSDIFCFFTVNNLGFSYQVGDHISSNQYVLFTQRGAEG